MPAENQFSRQRPRIEIVIVRFQKRLLQSSEILCCEHARREQVLNLLEGNVRYRYAHQRVNEKRRLPQMTSDRKCSQRGICRFARPVLQCMMHTGENLEPRRHAH